jgi:hypothetical protein
VIALKTITKTRKCEIANRNLLRAMPNMTAQDILVHNLKMDQSIWNMLLEDMSDADLLVRPVPGANHTSWQIGHLIAAEHSFLTKAGVSMPGLPEGFAQQHSKENVTSDKGFLSKDEYVKLYSAIRAASINAAAAATVDQLNQPNTGPMASMAPTIGSVYALVASHATMHVGQVSVVRRRLGKPVKF